MKLNHVLMLLFSGLITTTIIAQPLKPTSVYISWAAHDELSDTVTLTEALAMKEFDALLRLKKQGAQFDYYLMDMFWFDKDSGFRAFKKAGWPNGPDKWLRACKDNGIKPGLWLPTNITGWSTDPWMITKPEWKESAGGWLNLAMSLHSGNFLQYHIATMQQWYNRGVRMFKFDFASFEVATKITEGIYTNDEIRIQNEEAWFNALKQFKAKNPEVEFIAYNGYGGQMDNTYPVFKRTVKLKWLEVFSSMYCGDPRAADVPCHNFWRAKDIYSDHMVRQFEYNGVPLSRIDNSGFMIGATGTCYFRMKQAWKGMLILSAARGGWINTYYGNMDLLNEADGKWFAKVQGMFYNLQQYGQISTFGNIPGIGKPYGFIAQNAIGALITLVNPSQNIEKIELPLKQFNKNLLLFTDNGFKPSLDNNSIALGPEQMAVVGLGSYANDQYALGIQDDVVIPSQIKPIPVEITKTETGKASVILNYKGNNNLRIVFSQKQADDRPLRVTGGSPPKGIFMSKKLTAKAFQNNNELPLTINYDKQIWSGLSWAVAELNNNNINNELPIQFQYWVNDARANECNIECKIYEVVY